MSTSTIQFISQVKLAELRRQRALLLEAYDRLGRECAGKSPGEGLRTLLDGLRKIKVAGKPLHRDLDNLELLLQGTAPSPEIVAFWRRRLETELATGRLRADIVYLFGALLGEWGDEGESRQDFLEERSQAHDALLRQATTPAEAGPEAQSLLTEILAGLGDRLPAAHAEIARAITRWIGSSNNAVSGPGDLAGNLYQPAAIRQEAKRLLDDPVLQGQYEDALRVVTQDLRDWNWPAEGVLTRALWTRNKWRLYPTLSLVQLGILNSFGHFWSGAVEE